MVGAGRRRGGHDRDQADSRLCHPKDSPLGSPLQFPTGHRSPTLRALMTVTPQEPEGQDLIFPPSFCGIWGSPTPHPERRGPDTLSWATTAVKHSQEPSAPGTTTHRHPVSLSYSLVHKHIGRTHELLVVAGAWLCTTSGQAPDCRLTMFLSTGNGAWHAGGAR